MDCAWNNVFDDNDRNNLEEGMFITGLLSIAFGLWLNASILLTNLRGDHGYKNLVNFISAAWFARIVGVATRFTFINFLQSPDWLIPSCKFFAFLDTFFNVYEVEWLTHVAIDRYVVAKYINNGWPVTNHYNLYQGLCIFFASLYSVLPLFGIGRYGFELSCTSCTFDMMLPTTWVQYTVLSIFVLRSIKPVLVMFMMLFWARQLENKNGNSKENIIQRNCTKNVITIALVNIVCWTPLFLVKGYVVFSQLLNVGPTSVDPYYLNWSAWIQWISPVPTVMALFLVDKDIRQKMLNLYPIGEYEKHEIKKDI